MYSHRHNHSLSAFVLVVLALACLAIPARMAVAAVPGPGEQPAITPLPPESSLPSGAFTSAGSPQPAEVSAATWQDACPVQPADALGDPVFWTVLGLVVLGHFVLSDAFRQGH